MFATKEKIVQRLEKCTSCEHKAFLTFVPVCAKCRCPIASKAKLDSSTCPMNKW